MFGINQTLESFTVKNVVDAGDYVIVLATKIPGIPFALAANEVTPHVKPGDRMDVYLARNYLGTPVAFPRGPVEFHRESEVVCATSLPYSIELRSPFILHL